MYIAYPSFSFREGSGCSPHYHYPYSTSCPYISVKSSLLFLRKRVTTFKTTRRTVRIEATATFHKLSYKLWSPQINVIKDSTTNSN